MLDLKESISKILDEVKDGWCWPEKANAMANLITEIRPSPNVIVEIGVFGGRSLLPQAEAVRRNGVGCIVGIDPWRLVPSIEGDIDQEQKDWWSKVDLQTVHQEFMEHLWRLGLDSHCIIIRNTGDQCAHLFNGESIDILHIDGNHTEEVSCRDVRTWLPKVRRLGYIWFDDTNWASTQKALALIEEHCAPIKDVASCRLYQKR